jgi:hypothetical protein
MQYHLSVLFQVYIWVNGKEQVASAGAQYTRRACVEYAFRVIPNKHEPARKYRESIGKHEWSLPDKWAIHLASWNHARGR